MLPSETAVLPNSAHQRSEHAQNLQVLPNSTSAASLWHTMQSFTRAPGVRCSERHVGSGADFNTWDFASGAKSHQNVARGMNADAVALNTAGVPEALGEHHHGGPAAEHPAAGYAQGMAEHHEEPEASVTCWTCHRGATHPEAMAPLTSDPH